MSRDYWLPRQKRSRSEESIMDCESLQCDTQPAAPRKLWWTYLNCLLQPTRQIVTDGWKANQMMWRIRVCLIRTLQIILSSDIPKTKHRNTHTPSHTHTHTHTHVPIYSYVYYPCEHNNSAKRRLPWCAFRSVMEYIAESAIYIYIYIADQQKNLKQLVHNDPGSCFTI